MIVYVLLAVGLIDSLYLFGINLNQQVCLIDAPCLNEYTLTFAALGAAWFSAGFAVNYLKKRSLTRVWAFSGFAGIAFFVSVMIVERYFCPYCSLAHVVGGASAFLSLKNVKAF